MRLNKSKKILIICGPTATGKTGLGIELAKKFNGEIISADSRQVYIGMDIATGKDLPAKLKFKSQKSKFRTKNQDYNIGYYLFEEIPVWMLDLVRPNQEFSVSDYVDVAQKVLNGIWKEGKLPIIVGGTGLYIRGIVDGIATLGIPPNWELRRDLDKLSVNQLFEMVAKLNPLKAVSMNASDRKNPRRLIRAIEVAEATKNLKLTTENGQKSDLDSLFIGLSAPYEILYERIDKRINSQVEEGAEEEIKKLLAGGYGWDFPAMSALGYGTWKPYSEDKKTKEETIQQWKYDEHAYARRQMTWFKKNPRIHWFNISEQNWFDKVEQLVSNWYNKN